MAGTQTPLGRTILISGADAGYWPLLSGLLHSIESSARKEGVSIGVLDFGLAPEQLERLRRCGAIVVAPGWDYSLAHFRQPAPATFKAMTARPHLPRYFPGYELYVWLDADCWVQDWQAIRALAASARQWSFAVVPEVHRSYSGFYAQTPVLDFLFTCYNTCFGQEVAATQIHHSLLNSGVFVAAGAAPHWGVWHKHLAAVLQRLQEPFFFAEQTALNYAVRHEKLPAALLPAQCNWMCNRALPFLALDGKTLVEPAPPHLPLGVIHLTANTKHGLWPVVDLAGQTHMRVLTHPPLPT